MQVLLVPTSDGSDVGTGDEEPIRVDDLDEGPEAVSDTESVGRDSDLASVVFSEASTVSVEEPGIRLVATARDFNRVGSVGCFPPHRDLRETCQRGAGRHPRPWATRAKKKVGSFFSSSHESSYANPAGEGSFPEKNLQRLALFNGRNWQEFVSHSVRMAEQSPKIWCAMAATTILTLRRQESGPRSLSSWVGCQQITRERTCRPRHVGHVECMTYVLREPIPEGLDRIVSNIKSAKRGAEPVVTDFGQTCSGQYQVARNPQPSQTPKTKTLAQAILAPAIFSNGTLFSRVTVPTPSRLVRGHSWSWPTIRSVASSQVQGQTEDSSVQSMARGRWHQGFLRKSDDGTSTQSSS